MEQNSRKSKVKSISLNEYLLDRANKLINLGQFGSLSDVVATALSEFFAKQDLLLNENGTTEKVIRLLQTDEGKQAIQAVQMELLVKLLQTDEGKKAVKAILCDKPLSAEQKKNTQNPGKIEHKSLKEKKDDDEEEGEYMGEVIFD